MNTPSTKVVDSFKDDDGNEWELIEETDRLGLPHFYVRFNGHEQTLSTGRISWTKFKESMKRTQPSTKYIIVNEHNQWVTSGSTDEESPEEAIRNWSRVHNPPEDTDFYVYKLAQGQDQYFPDRTITL